MEVGATGAASNEFEQGPLAELDGLVNDDGTVTVVDGEAVYANIPRAVADFMMKERERARLFQSRMHDREDWVSRFCSVIVPEKDAHFLPDVVKAAAAHRKTHDRMYSRIASAQKEAGNGQ